MRPADTLNQSAGDLLLEAREFTRDVSSAFVDAVEQGMQERRDLVGGLPALLDLGVVAHQEETRHRAILDAIGGAG